MLRMCQMLQTDTLQCLQCTSLTQMCPLTTISQTNKSFLSLHKHERTYDIARTDNCANSLHVFSLIFHSFKC